MNTHVQTPIENEALAEADLPQELESKSVPTPVQEGFSSPTS